LYLFKTERIFFFIVSNIMFESNASYERIDFSDPKLKKKKQKSTFKHRENNHKKQKKKKKMKI